MMLIGVFNYIIMTKSHDDNHYEKVEAKRIVRVLEADKTLLVMPEKLDLSQYKTITRVTVFDPNQVCNNSYLVESAGGRLYRFEYTIKDNLDEIIMMNVALFSILLITIFVIIYYYIKIIRPFQTMSDMTVELAKGHLTKPIKEEKSKFFGKFIWGMDMLREHLEAEKNKSFKYEKDKKTLLMSLSHDIRTPLSTIKLYAKAVADGVYETEEEKREAILGIIEKADEISKYSNEIYSISRDDIVEFDVKSNDIYLSQIIEKIEYYYKEKLGVLHISFVVEKYDNCLIKADEDRLIECIQNLFENAIKYGDGEEIRLTVREEEECKLISVINSGAKIESSEVVNLFDSFYRGSNSSGIKGNGLGLYIVKKLMTMMQGEAFLELDGEKFTATLVVRKA